MERSTLLRILALASREVKAVSPVRVRLASLLLLRSRVVSLV